MKTSIALSLALVLLPSLAFAQAGQSPPTDPQSKRQQESPVVNNPAPSKLGADPDAATAGQTPPTDPQSKRQEESPVVNSPAPAGTSPPVTPDQKGPLKSVN